MKKEFENLVKRGSKGLFWHGNKDEAVIGYILEVDNSNIPYLANNEHWYSNFSPLQKEEVEMIKHYFNE